MAIVNRDLDSSQQRETYQCYVSGSASGISAGIVNPGVATGLTFPLCNIGFPAQLVAADCAAYGLSGTPVHSLWIYRFAGGFTSIAVGQTLTITAFGTSGVLGFSLFAATTFPLQSGDQLVLYTQGSNTAVANTTVTLVVKALQDIKTNFGV
jgi:hypothetical protein